MKFRNSIKRALAIMLAFSLVVSFAPKTTANAAKAKIVPFCFI